MEINHILEQTFANMCENRNYSDGVRAAVSNYKASLRFKSAEYIVREMPWRKDIEDFVSTLRIAGIKSIVLTDESHLLIEILHLFDKHGCTLDGLTTVQITDNSGERTLRGIRIAL